MHESPDSGEWLAHAHQDLDNGYQALFFVPANFNIKIGPGDEANINGASSVRGIPRIYGVYPVNFETVCLDLGHCQ